VEVNKAVKTKIVESDVEEKDELDDHEDGKYS